MFVYLLVNECSVIDLFWSTTDAVSYYVFKGYLSADDTNRRYSLSSFFILTS